VNDDLEALLDALVPGAARGSSAGLDDPPFPTDLGLELRGVLGRGGMGVVYEAWDPVVERSVAVKIARPDGGAEARKALLAEARRTARVDHPAVLPILAVTAANHLLCVITPAAPRGTLRDAWDVLSGPGGLPHRLGSLVTLAGALAAAHAAGVVHGDLHLDNVVVGSHGEPYLLDWGPIDDAAGRITGHLGYAAPEVLRGEPPTPASDAWSLGALLYEALTDRPIRPRREGETAAAFVRRSQGAPVPDLPPDATEHPTLVTLVRSLLDDDPAARVPMEEAQATISRVVTGQSERNRRARRAAALHHHAREQMELISELDERLAEERQSLAVQRNKVAGHAPPEQKRPVWDAEDRVAQLAQQRHEAWWLAVESAGEAYLIAPEPDEPRQTLAELWWRRLKDAEHEGDTHVEIVARKRVIELDRGPLRAMLEAAGTVSLEVDGDGPEATVRVARLVERGRRLVPEPVQTLPMPLRKHELERGSWLLTVEAPGRVPVPVPILVRRLHHHRGRVALHTPEAVGDGWVPMAEGPFRMGGDRDARQPLPPCVPYLGHRFVRRTLVTTAEWQAFLNALPVEQATDHVPGEAGLFGGFQPAWTHTDAGWMPPDGWDLDWPIFSIDMDDMQAFAAWRSEVEGRTVRLPTEEEWEKAARGADGRSYPWGASFDPTWCHMRQSRPGSPMPIAVGSYPVDTSVYGCVDMAGLLRELTASRFDDGQMVIRGGTWGDDADDCRCACRAGMQPKFRSSFVGFRLVAESPIPVV
jgi:serine/threonine-protein kinase